MRRILHVVVVAAWLLSMTLVYAGSVPQHTQHIWVALAAEGGPYAEVAGVLHAELPATEMTTASWGVLADSKDSPPDMIITVGHAAFEGMLGRLAARGAAWEGIPIVATLLPRVSYRAVLDNHPPGRRPVAALVLDQPVARQMALIRRALPNIRRVAVLPGPQTRPYLDALAREADARKLKLVKAGSIDAPEHIFASLRAALETADVLLALPDTVVYNSASLQNILLTTYRAHVPLIAFSPAYVRAGAMLAVYSTPSQIARQAAAIVRNWRATGRLPAEQMPHEFTVITNPKVAASLGIALDDATEITEDLQRQEVNP